ncbi:MAG: hypothetical protein AB7I27_16015 [Bacteriovoracaceae bacterium]
MIFPDEFDSLCDGTYHFLFQRDLFLKGILGFLKFAFYQFLFTEKVDESLKDIKEVLKENQSKLFDDIIYSKIVLGECSNGQNLCTLNTPFSDIVIDLKSLQEMKHPVTFSEFVGLIVHEFTHHFADNIDHPDYKFARFSSSMVLNNRVGVRTFSFKELIQPCESMDRKVYKACLPLAAWYMDYSNYDRADYFCKYQGFSKASRFHTSAFGLDDLLRVSKRFFWFRDIFLGYYGA